MQHKNSRTNRPRKPPSRKIVDRITYNPSKHKQKKIRALRLKAQSNPPAEDCPSAPQTLLKFGSFNVNGLDVEAAWAVEQLLRGRGFDVRNDKYCHNYLLSMSHRCWLSAKPGAEQTNPL